MGDGIYEWIMDFAAYIPPFRVFYLESPQHILSQLQLDAFKPPSVTIDNHSSITV